MTSGFDGDYDTNRICPLCGASAPGNRLEDRSLYEFEPHGGCGRFIVSYARMSRLALESDEQRERERQRVAAANAHGEIPLVQ